MDKKHSQRIHSKRRALERYGITVNRHTLREWVDVIQAGKSLSVERQSLRVSIHTIEHAGQRLRLVYDRQRKTVVTCLPAQ